MPPVISSSSHAFNASLDFEIERHGAYVREDGFKGIKIGMGKRGEAHLGYDFERDVRFVAGLREAIGPRGRSSSMDRGQSLPWTVADAIRRTQAFDEYRLEWMEEPLEPQDVEGFRRLREQVSCLIGTGEREFTVRGYRDVIASGISDVVGFGSRGRAGGITGGLKVIQLVEAANARFNAHAWSSAVTTAARPGFLWEYQLRVSLLGDGSPSREPDARRKRPLPTLLAHDHGVITVPDGGPGLGVEVIESVLEHYRLS